MSGIIVDTSKALCIIAMGGTVKKDDLFIKMIFVCYDHGEVMQTVCSQEDVPFNGGNWQWCEFLRGEYEVISWGDYKK